MNMQTSEGLDSYLDGQFGPEEAAEFEARLEGNADLRAEFNAIARQKRLIREAADTLDSGPVNLRTLALERRLAAALERKRRPRKLVVLPQWPGQAAAAAALVAFGWWGSSQFASPAHPLPAYVQEAVGAHGVFARDNLFPVEFSASVIPDVLGWFSQKMGAPIVLPDLRGLGLELVGARLLGTMTGPLLQYLYEDPRGARTTIVVARHPQGEPLRDIEVVDYPDRKVGYWRNSDFDYAIVAPPGSVDPASVASRLAR